MLVKLSFTESMDFVMRSDDSVVISGMVDAAAAACCKTGTRRNGVGVVLDSTGSSVAVGGVAASIRVGRCKGEKAKVVGVTTSNTTTNVVRHINSEGVIIIKVVEVPVIVVVKGGRSWWMITMFHFWIGSKNNEIEQLEMW